MRESSLTDYYEILQVSPRAEQETIDRVYRLMAKKLHPDNHSTGDAEKFHELTDAYRLLSDAEKRQAYDAERRENVDREKRLVLKASTFENAEEDRRTSQSILSLLYQARREDPQKPGLGSVHLEKLIGCAEKDLEFHIWYLKEKGWIHRLENGAWAITANGVDAVMEQQSAIQKSRLLPMPAQYSNGGEPHNGNGGRNESLVV